MLFGGWNFYGCGGTQFSNIELKRHMKTIHIKVKDIFKYVFFLAVLPVCEGTRTCLCVTLALNYSHQTSTKTTRDKLAKNSQFLGQKSASILKKET